MSPVELIQENGSICGKVGGLNQTVSEAVLLYENDVVERQKINNNEFSFKLKEAGRYKIKLFDSQGKGVWSSAYESFCPISEINKFLNLNDSVIDKKFNPQYFKSKYPFVDFSLVLHKKNNCSKRNLNLHKKYIQQSQKQIEIISTYPVREAEGVILFSGYSIKDSIILGPCCEDIGVQVIKDDLGCFTLIEKEGDSLTIRNDYLGLGKLFTFENESVFCCSNRYQLLFLHLRSLGIKLEIDKKILKYSILYHPWPTYTYQAFSENLLIDGIKLVNPGEYIAITNGEIKYNKSNLWFDLKEDVTFTRAKYIAEIRLATEEIKRNIQTIVRDKKFKNIICDVTGGMDSRMLLAALSNIDNVAETIKANTIPIKSNPGDLDSSICLTNALSLKYFDNPRQIKNLQIEDYVKRLSLSMGIYNDVAVRSQEIYNKDFLKLVGYFGELSRAYITRKRYNQNFKTVTELVESIFDNLKIYRTFSKGSDDLYHEFTEFFIAEIGRLPGKDPLEKFENFYLYFRNRIHCSSNLKHNNYILQIGPLQSRHVIRARHLAWGNFKNPLQVEADIIKILNPVLSKFPFASKFDDTQFKDIDLIPEFTDSKFENLNLLPNTDRSNYKNTENRTTYEFDEEAYKESVRTTNRVIFDNAIKILHVLKNKKIFTEKEAIDLFIRIKASFSKYETFGWAKWRIVNYLFNIYMHEYLISTDISDVKIQCDDN